MLAFTPALELQFARCLLEDAIVAIRGRKTSLELIVSFTVLKKVEEPKAIYAHISCQYLLVHCEG